jgi:MFS superfamily sulfate permease-like transporter
MSERIERGAWRHDLLASIVVFLVALPLCMGIAIASGVPTERAATVGILTGIIGGIVVGLLAGSPLLITGPAAGLSVLVYELVQRFGWERVGLIVLLAGALQVAAGLCRLGQWFRAVSPAVIHGMLAGIGVLIFASQFHIMLDDSPSGSGIQNLISIPRAIWRAVVPSGDASHHQAAFVGAITILVLLCWKPLAPRQLRVIPAPLVAVIVATLASFALALPIKQVELPENLLSAINFPDVRWLDSRSAWQALLFAAVSIAFIASAETLLSAAAVDKMHQGPRTRYNRELFAQGVGNMVSGFLGGLPMTGVIVRSAANVNAGARSNLSEVFHGVWLLVFVAVFPGVLRWIPTSSLAAILVYTGCKLVDLKTARALWHHGRSEAAIYAATVIAIVTTDLLTGVLLGIALSILKLVISFSRLEVRLEDDPQSGRTVMFLEGNATFINLPKLARVLEQVPHDRELHVHFDQLGYIDHACLDLLMNWKKQHESSGSSLVIDWESLTARFRESGKNGKGNGSRPHVSNGDANRSAVKQPV